MAAYFHQFSPARCGKRSTQATPEGLSEALIWPIRALSECQEMYLSGKVRIVKIDDMVNNVSSTFQVECGTGKYLQAASRSQNVGFLRFSEGDQAGKTSYRKFSVRHETHFLSSIQWWPQVARAAPCQGRCRPRR